MVLTPFEQELGLNDYRGTIKVSAGIYPQRDAQQIETVCYTTRANFHKACLSSKRYSVEKTVEMIKSNHPDMLKAIAYRGKITMIKSIPLLEKGCCVVGVTKE